MRVREAKYTIRVFVPPTPISCFIEETKETLFTFMFPAGGRVFDIQVLRKHAEVAGMMILIQGREETKSDVVQIVGDYCYIENRYEVKRGDVISFIPSSGLFAPCHLCFLYELNPKSRNIKYLKIAEDNKENARVLIESPKGFEAGSSLRFEATT